MARSSRPDGAQRLPATKDRATATGRATTNGSVACMTGCPVAGGEDSRGQLPGTGSRRRPGRRHRLGDQTRLTSLELGIERYATGNGDSGLRLRLRAHTVSWRSPSLPCRTKVDPRLVSIGYARNGPTTPTAFKRSRLRARVIGHGDGGCPGLNKSKGGARPAEDGKSYRDCRDGTPARPRRDHMPPVQPTGRSVKRGGSGPTRNNYVDCVTWGLESRHR